MDGAAHDDSVDSAAATTEGAGDLVGPGDPVVPQQRVQPWRLAVP